MRGDKEQECLDLVRKKCENGEINYFGLSEEEISEVEKVILAGIGNGNDFPDFTCDYGFIEHFQITSAKETKKGSLHIKAQVEWDRIFLKTVTEKETENVDFYYKEEKEVTGHCHSNLINSFKKNRDNHLQSLEKYNENYQTGVFLIQFTDFSLEIIEDGIYPRKEEMKIYRPCLDKMFLAELEAMKDKIKYVIVVTVDHNRFPFVAYPYFCSVEVFSTKATYTKSNDLDNMEIAPIRMTTVQQSQRITSRNY